MEYISLICWILAAACNAVMDKLSHHYHTSIFSRYNNPMFWNPKVSWRNKYLGGEKANGPAFYLSTGILVAFTDGWHLFKSMMIVLLAVTAAILPDITYFTWTWLDIICTIVILGTAWNVTFSLMYNVVLKK